MGIHGHHAPWWVLTIDPIIVDLQFTGQAFGAVTEEGLLLLGCAVALSWVLPHAAVLLPDPLHGSVAEVDTMGNPVVVPEAQVMGQEGEGDALIRRGPRTLNCNEYEEGTPSKRYRLEIPHDAYAGEVLQVELDQRPFSVTVPESFVPGEGVVVVAPAP